MIRALTLFALLAVIGLLALINWPAFTALWTLNLGFATVQVPLGLVMLGAVLFLSLLFTMWAISLQAAALSESRRHTREMQVQRELADKAEASRFVELRSHLSAELLRVSQASYEARADLLARMDRLQDDTRLALDDRLERGHLPPPGMSLPARDGFVPPPRR